MKNAFNRRFPKIAARRYVVCFLIALVLAAGMVGVGSMFQVVHTTTADRYRLSVGELNRLEERVNLYGDSEAAYRIALYYERDIKDVRLMVLWRRKAAALGNKSSRDWLRTYPEFAEKHSPMPSPFQ